MNELIRFTNNLQPISPESLKDLIPELSPTQLRVPPGIQEISPGYTLEYKLEISPGYSPEFKIEYPPTYPGYLPDLFPPEELNQGFNPDRKPRLNFTPQAETMLRIKVDPGSEYTPEPRAKYTPEISPDLIMWKRDCKICGEPASGTHYK